MITIDKWNGEDVIALCEKWLEESGHEHDRQAILEEAGSIKKNGEVFLLKDEEKIKGILGVSILKMFFTRDNWSVVRYWYVEPDQRFMARALLIHAMSWSKQMGCKKMMVAAKRLSGWSDE